MPGGGKKKVEKKKVGQPEVWAFLTIITFPIVLIATDLLGASGLWPFGYAALATFSVLVLEAIVRGRLWPFEDKFVDRIGHPDTPLRILFFLGATLLILETALVFTLATDRRYDLALLSLVKDKECAAKNDRYSAKLCEFLSQPYIRPLKTTSRSELTGYAIRKYAANSWFPRENLVTCSERAVQQSMDSDTKISREVHLVHCVAWKIGDQKSLAVKSRKTVFVGSSLLQGDDGTYQITAWTEDPNSELWKEALGPIASVSRDRALSLAILPQFETALQSEAQMRALDILKK